MARRLTKEQIISNVYYDLEKGFGSIQDTLKQAKEQDPSITRVDVETFMKKQPNKQIRGYRGSNSYTAPFSRFEYQIDIMDMVPLTREPEVKIPRKNTEPRYALVVIDIFSKLANAVPMKNKDGATVLPALKESFKKMGFRCQYTVMMTVLLKVLLRSSLTRKASITSSHSHTRML